MDYRNAQLKPGDRVILNCPENERLHGKTGKVQKLMKWGAFVLTDAAGTGQYRAGWDEMEKQGVHLNGNAGKETSYTGDPCDTCGSYRVMRTGKCGTCQDCGSTSGCS